ncbi:MAG: cobyric acid synthase [Muribaculaceae bacterium]|nr:cobyric acid synthase [Muribaculaceae bacterium]
MKHLRPLMIGGAGSDVGKSLLVAGLCRILRQDGLHPAPFKAQNMALNSYVTPDGLEMGRAQVVQAEAAGIECMAEMNPILLKPMGDCTSQVVLNGVPAGNRSAKAYFNKDGRRRFEEEVHRAFDRLSQLYDPIIMEGAGSIAEINLLDLDIVNMPMAKYAGAAVILVVDIARGGVFASAYGSIKLLPPEYRKLIKGIIVNKFRGDIELFAEGRRMLEEICGVPVVGVMPYIRDLRIEEEDSWYTKNRNMDPSPDRINVAVVNLPHISNFTDFDPLECDPRVNVFYTLDPVAIERSEIIIIPGSKTTVADLYEIRRNGVADAILRARKNGKTIVGICGGYQMMGRIIRDPEGVEGNAGDIDGLGLLPTDTVMAAGKLTRRVGFRFRDNDGQCTGYEIHNGRTVIDGDAKNVVTMDDGRPEGCMADERCWGTYIHGIFENKCVVDRLLAPFADGLSDKEFDYHAFKESQYDRLADEMRRHLDIDFIYKIMNNDD